jgi:hypothetical protein
MHVRRQWRWLQQLLELSELAIYAHLVWSSSQEPFEIMLDTCSSSPSTTSMGHKHPLRRCLDTCLAHHVNWRFSVPTGHPYCRTCFGTSFPGMKYQRVEYCVLNTLTVVSIVSSVVESLSGMDTSPAYVWNTSRTSDSAVSIHSGSQQALLK